MYKIIEAHWSTNPNDSHTSDDGDSTYAVLDLDGEIIDIFTKRVDAEVFVRNIRI